MNPADRVTDLWREKLQFRGFSDDGVALHGPVPWTHPERGRVTARVEVNPVGYPFLPPACRLIDAGATLNVTFHVDRSTETGGTGAMCLWDDDHSVDEAPWLNPDTYLARVSNWLSSTAAGWPEDTSVDLERYLPPDGGPLVVYDTDELAELVDVAVRTEDLVAPVSVRVSNDVRRNPSPSTPRRRHRKDQRLVWIADVGEINAPIRTWAELKRRLGSHADRVQEHVRTGVVERLLLRYTHSGRPGVLVARAQAKGHGVMLRSCESADTSTATRRLRAGVLQAEAGDVRVAIVGCGGIGSFLADLLYRSGVRRLTLIDYELLRPGNLVRHLAGPDLIGSAKVDAVHSCLSRHRDDMSGVRVQRTAVQDLQRAELLLRDHDVVVDATASPRASSILATAAMTTAASAGHYLVAVCTQRNGNVVRVDRLPARRHERHDPPLPRSEQEVEVYERGCGSPISVSAPGAVMHAAELACRVVLDAGIRELAYPATLIDVREPQPEIKYSERGPAPPLPGGIRDATQPSAPS